MFKRVCTIGDLQSFEESGRMGELQEIIGVEDRELHQALTTGDKLYGKRYYSVYLPEGEQGPIVGYAELGRTKKTDEWEIIMNYVDEPFRRRGYGKEISAETLDFAFHTLGARHIISEPIRGGKGPELVEAMKRDFGYNYVENKDGNRGFSND